MTVFDKIKAANVRKAARMIMQYSHCDICDKGDHGVCLGDADVRDRCIKFFEKWLQTEAPEDVLIEYCAECGGYVEIRGHDVMRDGYLTKCPVCGHMMRLCRACAEDGGVCDKTDRDADVCFREEP